MILTTDEGPDIQVEEKDRIGHSVETICGKTGKSVGRITVYRLGQNYCFYVIDRRKPVGKNRLAYLFDKTATVEQILGVIGMSAPLKAALRQANFNDPLITSDGKGVVDHG